MLSVVSCESIVALIYDASLTRGWTQGGELPLRLLLEKEVFHYAMIERLRMTSVTVNSDKGKEEMREGF